MSTTNLYTTCLHILTTGFSCYLWTIVLVIPIVHAFPAEVFDDKYQFIQEGHINLGAILSIHGKNGANDRTMPRDRFSKDADTLTPETGSSIFPSGEDNSKRSHGIDRDEEDDDYDGDSSGSSYSGGRKSEENINFDDDQSSNKMRKKRETTPNAKSDVTPKKNQSNVSIHSNDKSTSPSSDKLKTSSLSPMGDSPTNLLESKISKDTESTHDCSNQQGIHDHTTQNGNKVNDLKDTSSSAIGVALNSTSPTTSTSTPTTSKRRSDSSMFDSTPDRICSPHIANFQALENMVAILFALDEVNTRNDLLPGIDLGITILDDCFTPTLARARALQFMPGATGLGENTESQPRRRRRRHQQHDEVSDIGAEYQGVDEQSPGNYGPQRHHLHQQHQQLQHQANAIRQHGFQQPMHHSLSQNPALNDHTSDKQQHRGVINAEATDIPIPDNQAKNQKHNIDSNIDKSKYRQPPTRDKMSQNIIATQKQRTKFKTRLTQKISIKDSGERIERVNNPIEFRPTIKPFRTHLGGQPYPDDVMYTKEPLSRHNVKLYSYSGQEGALSFPHLSHWPHYNNTTRGERDTGHNIARNNHTIRDNFRLRKHHTRSSLPNDHDVNRRPTQTHETEETRTQRVKTEGSKNKTKDNNIIKRRVPQIQTLSIDSTLKPFDSSVSQSNFETNKGTQLGVRMHPVTCNNGTVLCSSTESGINVVGSKNNEAKKHLIGSSVPKDDENIFDRSEQSKINQPKYISKQQTPGPQFFSSLNSQSKLVPSSTSRFNIDREPRHVPGAQSSLHEIPLLPSFLKTPESNSSSKLSHLSRKERDVFQGPPQKFRRHSNNHRLPKFYDVVGIVGAYTSSLSVEVADVMSIFNLPQISYAATTDILADKLKYPVFFRTIPAESYQIQSMAELLRYFNWKYVSIVFSADAYGMGAEKSLKSLLHDLDICVAQTVELNDSMAMTDYENVILSLRSYKNARVVVLYADLKHISPLMTAVRAKKAYQEFIWAGSDTTSLVSEMEEENCRHIIGSLSITMNSSAPPKFKDYLYRFLLKHEGILQQFARQDPDKVYALFYEFSDVVRLKHFIDAKYFTRPAVNYSPTFTVSYAIDAVYAFAHAIQGFIKTNCQGATGEEARLCIQGRSIIPYLRSVNFQGTSGNVYFNEHGDVVGRISISQCQIDEGVYKQVAIATWDAEAKKALDIHKELQWPNQSDSTPRSLCANDCTGNEIYVFPRQTCCWNCVQCKVNEISIRNKTVCRQCPDLYWPEEPTFLTCQKIKPSYIRMMDLLPLTLAIITTLGLMISFITAFTFYTYRTERIIRSSSRELSSIMLAGVFCAFLLVLSLLSEPTLLKCYINHVGFGMTFTLVYGPLLVKTNRIYRIFTTSRKSAALPKRTSSAWQLLFASGFVLVQITIVTLSTIFAPPKVTHSMPIKTDKYVIGYCDLALAGFLPSIAYNFALVLVCTWYAFKTRRLPDNYNESRYIAFCVDTTVLVWISFIPTYFAMKRPYYKVVILALALLINSIVCLLLLFVPKMYALYMSKQRLPSQSSGTGQPGDFHMQLMSNFSMSGLIRSTPSFYYGDSNGVLEERTGSMEVHSPQPSSQRPSASVAGNELCSINEHDVTLVSSSAVFISESS